MEKIVSTRLMLKRELAIDSSLVSLGSILGHHKLWIYDLPCLRRFCQFSLRSKWQNAAAQFLTDRWAMDHTRFLPHPKRDAARRF